MSRITELEETVRDAERWRKLLKLVGTPANASDEPVTLSWDDATMTPFITIGRGRMANRKTTYYAERGSFEQVIDAIPDPVD